MAKSARSSNTKRNNANLRARVFGPAADARTARLSAKLQEIAAKPRPTSDKVMDVDNATQEQKEEEEKGSASNDNDEEMELDSQGVRVVASKNSEKKRLHASKIHKVSKRKPRNQMVFASERARKARQASKKASR